MKLHRQFAIVIAKTYGDVIYSISNNYNKIVDEFKTLKSENPNTEMWIQPIIG